MRCECEKMLEEYRVHSGTMLFSEMLKKAFLRDWFAGMALQGMLSNASYMVMLAKDAIDEGQGDEGCEAKVTEEAYGFADAMIEARKIVVELSDETPAP